MIDALIKCYFSMMFIYNLINIMCKFVKNLAINVKKNIQKKMIQREISKFKYT